MRIIVVDDHALVRKGFEALLNYQPDMDVVATAASGQEAYQLVGELLPDIVLLDISMPPGESGQVTVAKLHADFPETKTIMLTMHDDREYLLYAMQNGARGYVLKNAPEEELLEAVRTVYNGGMHLSKTVVPHLVYGFVNRHQNEEDSLLQLQERELEVLTLIAKGYGNKEIANQLYISVKTVESHKSKIMRKLDMKTRAELVEYAVKKRLLQY